LRFWQAPFLFSSVTVRGWGLVGGRRLSGGFNSGVRVATSEYLVAGTGPWGQPPCYGRVERSGGGIKTGIGRAKGGVGRARRKQQRAHAGKKTYFPRKNFFLARLGGGGDRGAHKNHQKTGNRRVPMTGHNNGGLGRKKPVRAGVHLGLCFLTDRREKTRSIISNMCVSCPGDLPGLGFLGYCRSSKPPRSEKPPPKPHRAGPI